MSRYSPRYPNAKFFKTGFLRGDSKKGWKGVLKYQDANGVWRQKQKSLKAKSRASALAELDAWQSSLEMGCAEELAKREIPGASITVTEYVDGYIAEKAGTVEASTITGYRRLLRNCIAPTIGDVKLSELEAQTVADWVRDLAQEKTRNTAKKSLVLLRSALAVAKTRGVIETNPTDTVEKPRDARKKRPNSLSEHGRGAVAAYVAIDPTDALSLAIRLALYTGMRRGEICALRWRDVDIERRTLHVTEALGTASPAALDETDTESDARAYAGVYIKEPKNGGSNRFITFPKSTADALKARRDTMAAASARAGVPLLPSTFVCGEIDGSPMHPHNLWRRWNGLVTAMGLVGVNGTPPTFHDLRHTYATTAIANGIDVKTVSNQLGHASAAMTLNVYATVDPDAARRAAEKMDEVMTADAELTN